MLSLKYIRENTEEVKKRLAKKHVKSIFVDDVLSLDKRHRELLRIVEGHKAEQNKISDEIAQIKGSAEKNEKINEMQSLKTEIKKLELDLEKINNELQKQLKALPNMPQDFVPEGEDETNNVLIREVGEKKAFSFDVKDYMALAEKLDIIDMKRAAKVSGSRFGYLKGDGALLEFALIGFVIHTLRAEGFTPIIPPVLVNERSLEGMGYIDVAKDKDEVFYIEKDNLYLTGTSEQSIGPMHQDEVFAEADLPKRYIAFSSCFRREAGSYGKDTKGILRVHQFDKLEMFCITTSEQSQKEHEYLLSLEEKMMQQLGIAYRVLLLCAGDSSRQSAGTYDIEAWFPGQNTYRETHSVSNTLDYQSRALNIRYKSTTSGIEHVHMLNGTAFAIGRILIAILENYQQEDGSVRIPDALVSYMDGITVIRK